MRAFLNKGRMTELASRMPVNVILDSRVALLGAARFGLDTMSGDGFENIEEGEEVEIDGEKSRTVV